MTIKEVLTSLLPAEAYAPSAPIVARHIDAEANLFSEVASSLERLHGAMHPVTAVHDIESWEQLFAIAPLPGSTTQQRIQAIQTKQAEVGGLSRKYFIQMARAAGYAITILEPLPFEVGIGRCGEALFQEEVRYVWQVQIDQRPEGATKASDEALRATFLDLKAAHTYCEFLLA
jgi:uncharacterized protein YmfQ (DUF2313 family)